MKGWHWIEADLADDGWLAVWDDSLDADLSLLARFDAYYRDRDR